MNALHSSEPVHVWRPLAWVAAYAVAMGLLEAICVIYIRQLLMPDGSIPAQKIAPVERWPVEIIREACTMVMLLAVAWIAGFNLRSRAAFFFFAFAVWDIIYYVGLKWLANWPASWLEWDCLFLIPKPWYGPVLAPVLISAMIGGACCVLLAGEKRKTPWRVSPLSVGLQVLACATWYWSFVKDSEQIHEQHGYAKVEYSWTIFAIATLIGAAGLALSAKPMFWKQDTKQPAKTQAKTTAQ